MHRKAELDRTLATFLGMLEDFFGDRLVSVVLYGSVVFDDLAPGYGDLDFLAVVDDDGAGASLVEECDESNNRGAIGDLDCLLL